MTFVPSEGSAMLAYEYRLPLARSTKLIDIGSHEYFEGSHGVPMRASSSRMNAGGSVAPPNDPARSWSGTQPISVHIRHPLRSRARNPRNQRASATALVL